MSFEATAVASVVALTAATTRKWGEMASDKEGEWINSVNERNFSVSDTIRENLNNCLKFHGEYQIECEIRNGHSTIGTETFKCMRFKETGGPGFETEAGLNNACKKGASDRTEDNNFGVGMKSETMIPGSPDFLVIKVDTQLRGGRAWKPNPDGGDPSEYKITADEMQCLPKENSRIFISFWGPDAASLLDQNDLATLLETKVDCDEEDNVFSTINRNYGKHGCKSKITYNDKPINVDYFDASRAKTKVIAGQSEGMEICDTVDVLVHKGTRTVLECTPALRSHRGNTDLDYDGKPIFIETITNKSGKLDHKRWKYATKASTSKLGPVIAKLTIGIMWTGNDEDDHK